MDDRTAATIVYSPGEVAQRLGISTAMLRRHANTYQEVFSDLVLDARSGYQYTDAIVSRLEQSLAAVHAGHVQSVKDGLERLSEGSGLPEAYEPQPEPLHVLAEALQALHGEIQALRGEVAALREDNGMLQEQLKALEPPKEVEAGDVADPETLSELEEQRRLNAYLKGEIVRRDLEAENVKRPWWKWW